MTLTALTITGRVRTWLATHPLIALGAWVVVLLLGWCAWHSQALSYEWSYDDLHLIRRFTPEEMRSVFVGTYDPDGIETRGFRPFMLLFNHARYVLAGENPLAQRLLVVGLAALGLWLVGWTALALGIPPLVVGLALLVFAASRAFTMAVLWLTDGIFIFQMLLLAASLAALVRFVRDRQPVWGVVSLALAWVALWSREDSLVLLLLAPLFVVAAHRHFYGPTPLRALLQQRRYVVYTVALAALAGLTLLYRQQVVPNATSVVSLQALPGPLLHGLWSVWPVGSFVVGGIANWTYQASHLGLTLLSTTWGLAVGALAVAYAVSSRRRATQKAMLVCLAGMVITSLPGLATIRGNLVVLPTLFFCFALALMVDAVVAEAVSGTVWSVGARRAALVLVLVVCGLAVFGAAYRARLQSYDLHPLSINKLRRDYIFVYGPLRHATIPPERRTYVEANLARLNLTPQIAAQLDAAGNLPTVSPEDHMFLHRYLAARAADDLVRPGGEDRVFVPAVNWLAP